MIIFDFDGVLADSLQTCIAACTIAAKSQGKVLAFGENTFAELDPLTFEALAERHGLEPRRFAGEVAEAVSDNPVRSPLFKGVVQTLNLLAQTQPLSVVSASHNAVIRSVLGQEDLDRLMTHIIGGDTRGHKAAKINGLISDRPHETHVMVGDAVSDMHAACTAGICTVGVSWGWQSPDRLLTAGADAIARSSEELASICLNLINQ